MKAVYHQVSWNCSILVISSFITCMFPQILPRMGIPSSNHLGIGIQSDDVFITSAAFVDEKGLEGFLKLACCSVHFCGLLEFVLFLDWILNGWKY